MLISTEICSFEKYGTAEEVVAMLKGAGFDAYDYSMFYGHRNNFVEDDRYVAKAKALRSFADGVGIKCNQSHAPFPTVREGDEQYNRKAFGHIARAIEICGILGGKNCVVHPWNNYNAEQNAEIFFRLIPYAEAAGVTICTENMWNWNGEKECVAPAACSDAEDFVKHLRAVNSPYLKACLDLGHAEMTGLGTSAVEMIRALGDDLVCLHIHDNDRRHDSHALPFTRDMDFYAIISALKEIGYKGDITFEADQFARRFPRELIPAAAEFMCSIGKYFKGEISGRR